MNSIIKHNVIFQLAYLILTCLILNGQTSAPYKSPVEIPQQTGKFQHSIQNHNRLQMNQGFTLTTSMNNQTSYTTGIYSNFSQYKLSQRIKLNMGFHLIQNQTHSSLMINNKPGLAYNLGLEYKVGENSLFNLQIVNHMNSNLLYRNSALFNVP